MRKHLGPRLWAYGIPLVATLVVLIIGSPLGSQDNGVRHNHRPGVIIKDGSLTIQLIDKEGTADCDLERKTGGGKFHYVLAEPALDHISVEYLKLNDANVAADKVYPIVVNATEVELTIKRPSVSMDPGVKISFSKTSDGLIIRDSGESNFLRKDTHDKPNRNKRWVHRGFGRHNDNNPSPGNDDDTNREKSFQIAALRIVKTGGDTEYSAMDSEATEFRIALTLWGKGGACRN